jgi:hypothetical protein
MLTIENVMAINILVRPATETFVTPNMGRFKTHLYPSGRIKILLIRGGITVFIGRSFGWSLFDMGGTILEEIDLSFLIMIRLDTDYADLAILSRY